MNARILVVALLMSLPIQLLAQRPDWLKSEVRASKYSPKTYLSGYAISLQQYGEDPLGVQQRAAEAAKTQLIHSVWVRLESQTNLTQTENNNETNDELSVQSSAYSKLDVPNLQQEIWFDKGAQQYHVLVHTPKAAIADYYQRQMVELEGSIKSLLDRVATAEAEGKTAQALRLLVAISAPLHKYYEVLGILAALDKPFMVSQAIQDFDVESHLRKLYDKPLTSAEELAKLSAYVLQEIASVPASPKLTIAPLRYQDTRFFSPFSRQLQQLMQAAVPKGAVGSCEGGAGDGCATNVVIEGTYWEADAGSLKVLITYREANTGTIIGGLSINLSAQAVAATGLPYKPQNFTQAVQDQQQLAAGEFISDTGLQIEAWTDKGQDGLIYTDGEPLAMYIRTNLPCYVRLVYHLADGKRTMLLDNYYLDASKVNKVYQIPSEFVCAEPFGVECMQVLAATEEFPPVETKTIDGYQFLTEDLDGFLKATRGIKPKSATGIETLKAERRLVLTTLAK